jgi:hypothetical protein
VGSRGVAEFLRATFDVRLRQFCGSTPKLASCAGDQVELARLGIGIVMLVIGCESF